jgi:hypothetical protein
MGRYQVAIIARPVDWKPECPDDVPLELSGPVEVLAESDDLFEAVDRAVQHNESDEALAANRWAVVIEPGVHGRHWPAARLCTPITYKVTSIWWPEGWEPDTPLDVPNCVWQAQGKSGGEWYEYPRAEAAVRALNRQCLDQPGTIWYVVMAVENEAVAQTISYDPTGTETTTEVRRMHVIRPASGGHGDCRNCPAHDFSCAKAEWSSIEQTVQATRSRVFGE